MVIRRSRLPSGRTSRASGPTAAVRDRRAAPHQKLATKDLRDSRAGPGDGEPPSSRDHSRPAGPGQRRGPASRPAPWASALDPHPGWPGPSRGPTGALRPACEHPGARAITSKSLK